MHSYRRYWGILLEWKKWNYRNSSGWRIIRVIKRWNEKIKKLNLEIKGFIRKGREI
jgi:hypothetical protein